MIYMRVLCIFIVCIDTHTCTYIYLFDFYCQSQNGAPILNNPHEQKTQQKQHSTSFTGYKMKHLVPSND